MKTLYAAGAFALLAGAAGATTISVNTFTAAEYNALLGSLNTSVTENFEGFSEGNITDGWSDSAVGSFATVGGTGTGGTVNGGGSFTGNDGSELALRDGTVYGRSSTTKILSGNDDDDMFLDSNDTHGIQWDVAIGGDMFNRLLFTLTDATDVGATMKISTEGGDYSFSGLGNANKQIVLVSFANSVSAATVLFENFKGDNYKLNDGFSLDDMTVGEVPVPAAGLLLIGGLGALGAMRARKKRAEA